MSMFRRVSSAAMLMMLLTVMTAVSNVKSVKALGPIYIKYDGRLDPPDAPISTDDNITYTFTGDISQTIIIERSSIVLDGAGHALLRGSQYLTYGIVLSSVEDVTVRNTNISAQCQGGIYLDSSSRNNTLSNNIVMTNVYGIMLDSSSDNTLMDNNVTANTRHGIYLNYSANNYVSDNNVNDSNLDGIHLQNSPNNKLLKNNGTNNGINGICLDSSVYNYVSNNSVAGNDFYGIDLQGSSHNTLVENDASGNKLGGIYLYSSFSNNVSGNTITGVGRYYQLDGIRLDCSDFNMISGNKITANSHNGVSLCAKTVLQSGSLNNNVSANEITENIWEGIFLDGSSGNNAIRNNSITANLRCGIWLESSGNTVYENNIIANNESGVRLTSCSGNTIHGNNISANNVYGAHLSYSRNNLIYGNNITYNKNYGIWLFGQSDGNTICGNNLLNNSRGVDLTSSNNNKVYHNNFAGNAPLASSLSSTNTDWDNGYPSGGNYWADNPDRRDNYRGPDQDQPGSDGIGDTSYVIDSARAQVDNYPLMSSHYVVTNITCHRTAVAQGYCINTSITVSNCGAYAENVNLTLSANSTLIDQTVITLNCSQAQHKTFTWKASNDCVLYKNYSLTAYVSPVSEETSLIGHNSTYGCVVVTLVGDITGPNDYPDGVRNMLDIGVIAKAFGATQNADDGWYWHPDLCHLCPHKPNYDTNNDGRIDMKDVGLVAKNFTG